MVDLLAKVSESPGLLPVLITAIIVLVGLAAQVLASRLKLPSILLLLAAGMALGPDGLGVIRPQVYGGGLRVIVALAVAVIVFEGAMLIDVDKLRGASRQVISLITIGVATTSLAAAGLAWALLGLSPGVALLFGAIVSVTGPTVISPILERVPLEPHLATTLEGESVFADAVGVLLAASIYTYLANPWATAASGLAQLMLSLAIGALAGAATAWLGVKLLNRLAPLPGSLVRLGVLAIALTAYGVGELLGHEAGILAVAVAGLVAGNMSLPYEDTIKQFKGDLTTLGLSLVFILLAANLPLRDVWALGWPAVGLVALLILMVRPLTIALATWGSGLRLREKAFLAFMAPRGIVAAATATFFSIELAARHVPGADKLGELVFLVVLATVVLVGFGAHWVAGRLALIPPKTIILGGDRRARYLAERLVQSEEPIEVWEDDLDKVHDLLGRGLPACLHDIEDCDELARHGVRQAHRVVVATDSDERNRRMAEALRGRFPKLPLYVRLNESENLETLRALGVEVWPQTESTPLALPLSVWNAAVQPEAAAEVVVRNPAVLHVPLEKLTLPAGSLLIVLKRRGRTVVPNGKTVLWDGDEVTVVGERDAVAEARRLLAMSPRSWRSARVLPRA
jgi:NhaP-type Na+/H+ or K+/H+ antiporter